MRVKVLTPQILQALCISLFIVLLVTTLLLNPTAQGSAAPASFRFVAWSDTQGGIEILSQLSDQAAALNPAFTIYPGDLEDEGFTVSGMNDWKYAMNGQLSGDEASNGIFDITFPVRGNHDAANKYGWQTYFDMAAIVGAVGATHYSFMPKNEDLVYSFDFANAHFVGLDVLGDAYRITSAQIAWLDEDLAAAEARGLEHAFIQFHGPIYCIQRHCGCVEKACSVYPAVQELVSVLNKHPIVTATFNGHEHAFAYTFLDASRIPPEGNFEGITHPFHQFVTGVAGGDPGPCLPHRCEYNMAGQGFVTVDVSGPTITVSWYALENEGPVHTLSFTKDDQEPFFVDVREDYWAYAYIKDLFETRYISGCSSEPLSYCPESGMSRAESAVFVERGIWGGGYMPPDPEVQNFADVTLDEWYAKWAGAMWADGYTEGCGTDVMIFCPVQAHTRAEATVFFERMLHGKDYIPEQPTIQVFDDVPVGPDAPWYSKWVMAAYDDGIISGCEDPDLHVGGLFRPLEELTRAEGACMMFNVKSNQAP
jgi:hypothetical protein